MLLSDNSNSSMCVKCDRITKLYLRKRRFVAEEVYKYITEKCILKGYSRNKDCKRSMKTVFLFKIHYFHLLHCELLCKCIYPIM